MNTINLNPIKNSRDCEPEFQIATQEQKMLKYFSNSEPKPDQNKNELHNPCVPYSPDPEKNRDTLAQFDNKL
ncbi:hypothetical protein JTB14_001949 [Gonioctena quinquepunctata]|nr:hypothetical protein JTB14_001949 [Gonioctena quinquepunctata]